MTNRALGLKIGKLLDYIDGYELSIGCLPTTKDKSSYSYDDSTNEIIHHSWDESHHNGDSYNEGTTKHQIKDVGEEVLKRLMDIAMEQATREYDREQEEKRRKEKEKIVKTYLTTKLFGQSVDFIAGD